MKTDLPPLLALTAFEAAGRLQSFTRAAAQLNVTQAAVSRQIRLLEEHLGRKLFLRAHRSVQLTSEGRSYLHTVATALAHVAAATRELKADTSGLTLSVAVDQAVAHLWLAPRLRLFTGSLPGLTLNLVVSDDERTCLDPAIDVAVIQGEGGWPGHESAVLFAEEVFPVCSPAYRDAIGAEPLTVELLASEALIDLDDDHWNWMNWRQWLSANGVGAAAGPRRLRISSYPLVIDAARRGHGVALGWRGLVDDDLEAGHLCAPLRVSVRTRFGYHALWPRERPRSPAAHAFLDWLQRQ
jgi:DNA-binding transcriptional LysR family regulator